MIALIDSIKAIPFNRIAISNYYVKITYGSLVELYNSNKVELEIIKNANVVINERSRLEFAQILVLLDGIVSSMMFLPKDIDKRFHENFYKEADINYEVSLNDGNFIINKINNKAANFKLESTKWIIPTSGTTNIPKLVSHTLESLSRTSKIDIEKGEGYRWGLVFDIYRFSGIQVYLQSILGGSELIISEANMSISQIINNLIKNSCNALSATPSFWRKVLMTAESNKLTFKVITLGGEIADENILKALRIKYSKSKLLHIYASTEVGVGFSVTDEKTGFPLSYLENDINDIELKLSDANTLMIKNSKHTQSYVNNNKLYEDDGFIDTGDIVCIKNNRVYFSGRDSGAINVGGNKVQPEEVESVILSSNLISEVAVYPKNNSMMGNLVCADIVAKDELIGKKELKQKLLVFCRGRLDNYKVPAILKFVKNIETTQSGKIKRG